MKSIHLPMLEAFYILSPLRDTVGETFTTNKNLAVVTYGSSRVGEKFPKINKRGLRLLYTQE